VDKPAGIAYDVRVALTKGEDNCCIRYPQSEMAFLCPASDQRHDNKKEVSSEERYSKVVQRFEGLRLY
jgi:hypothetical protein